MIHPFATTFHGPFKQMARSYQERWIIAKTIGGCIPLTYVYTISVFRAFKGEIKVHNQGESPALTINNTTCSRNHGKTKEKEGDRNVDIT